MSVVIVLFEVAAAFTLVIFGIWFICSMSDNIKLKKRYPTLNFETFKKFYDINPDRWLLSDNHVECKVDNIKHLPGRIIPSIDYERFCFGWLDTFKYTHWLKCQHKKEIDNKHFESKSKMLLMVKQDIADLERRAEHEKDSALDILQQVINNKEALK